MKKIYLSFLTLVTVSLLFVGCVVPWDMGDSLGRLKGDVVFMGVFGSSNGHDTATLNFEENTFSILYYTLDFPTAAAETSGNYTDNSWFQDGGLRGSFTYDNDSKLLTLTVTQVYMLKSGAVTTYSADYEWHTLVAADETEPWAGSVEKSYSINALLTQDGMIPAYVSSGTDNWVSSSNITYVDGSTERDIDSVSITSTSFTKTYSSESAAKDAPASAISHYVISNTYTINNFFLVGEETGDKEFAKVWKKGNTVTFILERTKYTQLDYTGATAPTIPAADETSGTASTGTSGVDYASINLVSDTDEYSFAHMDDVIVDSEYLIYAVRGLE